MINDVIEIGKMAGEIIRDGFGTSFRIDYKTNEKNLVTEIDKASEELIVNQIKNRFPTHNILAEEGSEVSRDSDFLWVIDPLDGTTNFAHGLPIFSVSIGVQKDGETILGIVYDVMRDVVFSAEKGSGAFANSEKVFVSSNDKLEHSLLVTGFPYNVSDNPEHALERFTSLTKKVRGIRRLGSAAIDFCYLASGVFDGFWEVHLHPWDICAGKLIAEEAGGIVTDFNGKSININSKRILASNNLIHKQLIKAMKEFE